jgi:nucleoside-diphosphate-sugar epimerase
VKSKTLAECAAWDFIDREGGDLQLAVVSPVAIFGPALSGDPSDSIELLQRMLAGTVPALPQIEMSAVDVRDVADLHVRAMTHPKCRWPAIPGGRGGSDAAARDGQPERPMFVNEAWASNDH